MDLTVKLQKPVTTSDGQVTTELTFRELTVDELIIVERQSAGKGDIEQDKILYAMSCGVSPEVIGKVGQRDWVRLRQRYWSTLGKAEPEPATAE